MFDKEGSVGIVTLNRPEKKNAFSFEMIHGLLDYFSKAELDDSIRSIVMTGTGRSFCSGADLSGRGGRKDVDTPVGMKISALAYGRVFFAMATLEKPIITAVNGLAAGAGLSIALGGDIVVASEGSKFIQVFVRRGLHPDAGSCFILPRLIGLARAKEMMLFGEDLPAEEALKIGLINRVVPEEKLMEEAMVLAKRLASGPTRAIGMMKKLINRSFELDIQSVLDFEAAFQAILISSEDVQEGISAFLEKRTPEFKGR